MPNSFGNSVASLSPSATSTIAVNANTTLTSSAYGNSFRVTAACTVTLPLTSKGGSGKTFTIVNDTSSGSVVLSVQGSDYIRIIGSNATSFTLNPGDAVSILNMGSVFGMASSGASKAPLASPAFTGTPTAPTAAVDTNTTQLATTAFVIGQATGVTPSAVATTASTGAATTFARADHVHPNTAPTATSGDNTTKIATTAFVQDAVGTTGFGGSTQTWQAVTRSVGTTYYNTTGRAISLAVQLTGSSSGGGAYVTVNGVNVYFAFAYSGGGSYTGGGTVIIPSGASYVLQFPQSATYNAAYELR
jgi:hypothetical protein